jgi:hypothetical protein
MRKQRTPDLRRLKKKNFKCPYCGVKNIGISKECKNCKLEFNQLENLSNKEAKRALRRKLFLENIDNSIIYTKYLPYDVSIVKLWLCFAFFGLLGGQNLYVGKKKGWISLILFPIGIACVIVEEVFKAKGTWPFGPVSITIIGCLFFLFPVVQWALDFFALLTKNFTVPVKLKTPVDVPYFYQEQKKETESKKN